MTSSATSRPIVACQICENGDLRSVLYLGSMPPVNTMPDVGTIPEEQSAYPLELVRCDECTLVQIGLEVDPEVLFPPDYPYRSASTKVLRENFAELERDATALLGLRKDDLVVDIGANDGTLLSNFQRAGYRVLGVEPSMAAQDAIARGIPSKMAFFTEALAGEIRHELGPASLVTAANVFAHIPDVHAIVRGIVSMLTDDGVFVSENHYFPSLVETLQYDTIYHEHLRYYSLGSLEALFTRNGLEVFAVRRIPTHGGSIRVYTARPGQQPVDASVEELRQAEADAGITDGSALADFRRGVLQSKLDLHELIAPLKRDGARIYGIGAPSRASTLLNYVGLDDGIVDCVMEISTSGKLDKYMPGTRIPVLDEEKLFTDQPEYALLLSWHISDELIANLRRKGYRGKFIVPLPTPVVIDS